PRGLHAVRLLEHRSPDVVEHMGELGGLREHESSLRWSHGRRGRRPGTAQRTGALRERRAGQGMNWRPFALLGRRAAVTGPLVIGMRGRNEWPGYCNERGTAPADR